MSAQQNLTWDANGAAASTGGTGTWDTNAINLTWFNGATFSSWNNPTFDNAIFGGTAGTVTLGEPINAHNLTFTVTGFTLTGNTLTLGGTTPTITTNAGVTATIGAVIAGPADLAKAGTGTLTLTGANTYTGATTIAAGTLAVGNGGTAGTLGTGTITNNATLSVNRSDTLTVANAISGTGAVIQNGNGTTILTGANTYTGGTTINNGVLQLGDGGTTGSIVGNVNVTTGEDLAFNRSDTVSFGGVISGAGTVRQIGTGTTVLTATNTYTGGTVITTGALQLGNGGTTGSIAGNVTNSGQLIFNRANAVTFGGVVSGVGGLTQLGTGTTTLTGANTYTGSTTITAGTLQIGNGGTTGALGPGATMNNSALIFNRSNTLTVASAIGGTGTVTKLGGGTTILTRANTYTGTTTITAGILQIGNGATGTLGSGAVINNATLNFNRSNALTVANAISGTGAVIQNGNGTTILTGANTYTGGTTINNGVLQLGDGGTTGSIVGNVNVTTGEDLAFNRSDTVSFGGVISGAGTVRQIGTGTTVLTATNTYTGGTVITAGALQLGNGGTTGSIAGNVTNSGQLIFNRANAVTFGGVVSGVGGLTQLGTGTTTLTGANTYTGSTTITAGTLQIGNGGTTGALGPGATMNNSALIFNRSNTLTVASAIGGTGTVTKLAAGTTILTGANTYTGTTTISAGILQIGNGATGTLGSGAVINNAALSFSRNNALTVANDISGTGTVTKANTGTTMLTGANTYTGTTTISAGTLQIGAGGTTGTLGTGAITNNATLSFNRSDTVTVANVVGGTGAVRQIGTGTTVLTGTNTYTGGTVITAGALQLGNGGTTGSIAGNVTNSGQLIFKRADAVTFGGVVSGVGGLTQLGTGTTTLTGANTYTGSTTITAGTLQIGNGGTTGALGPGATMNNSALIFNRSNTLTVASAIGGTGTVTKLGGGTTILTGANTYTGTTTISAGILQIGNGATGTLGSGAVINNATLNFNRSNALTVASAISGTGAVIQNGNGTTILTGANTYTGGTTINNGVLQLGDGGTTGSIVGNVNVTTGEDLAFNRSDTMSFGGVISGAGTVRQIGTGTTVLTATNTYTGGTVITAGALQVGNGGTTGSIAGNVTNSGQLIFNRADAVTFGGVVSGVGGLTQLGTGTTTLTGANTYTGSTTITAGTLQIGNGGTAGSIVGDVTNNGALAFNRADAVTFGGVISGTGSLMQLGAGTTTLTGANTYSGGTTISAGTLEIGDGGTAGTIGTGNVTNNAALRFNRSDSVNVANIISGTGSVTQFGAGTTILTGTNTYTGGTTITSGALQIGNGGTTGSIVGDVFNSGSLAFNRSDSLSFGGSISGTGSVVKDGTGTLSLSGASTYSGSTIVNSGTLLVNGSLGPTALSVGNGATLGGVGSIAGDVTLDSGATLSPGLSPGTLTVGSLNLSSGTILDYELSVPSVVGGGTNDLVAVNGNLTLDGRLDVTDIGGFGGGSYTLMTYGGALTDRGVAFGFLPDGFGYQLASGGGLVQLLVSTNVDGSTLYWDGGGPSANGVVNGGSGIWMASLANWTTANGAVNTTWQNQRAVFRGAPGTVTVQGPVTFTEMHFDTNGYKLTAGAGGVLRTGSSRTVIDVRSGARATIAAPIAGSGGLVKRNGGTLVLTGANLYTGGTTVSAGILQGNTRSLVGNIVNNATVTFDQSSTGTYSGRMSGDGKLIKNGSGSLVLTGPNTYSGGTLVSDGVLLGNSSSVQGDITNNAAVIFDQQANGRYGGVMSGTGRLTKTGDRTLVITGANTYQGGTIVAAGTLTGDAGSLQGDIFNNAALIFDQSSDAAFRGRLFGTGTMTKSGNGTLMFSGAHAFQGATRVESGTLALDGSLVGSVDVAGSAVFNANGAIGGALNVRGSANIATFAVGGDVTFSRGSQYGVALDRDGTSSILITSARASIDGASVVIGVQPGIVNRRTDYRILQADAGLSGTAQAVSNAATHEPWLSQTDTTLFATLLRTDLPLQAFATTANGVQVGGAIDRLRSTGGSDIAGVTRELTALDNSALAVALDSVAGEIHASSIQLTALDGHTAGRLVRDEIAARAFSSGPNVRSSATTKAGWGIPPRWWMRLHGQEFNFDRVPTAQGGRGHLRGFLLGLDWSPAEGWLVGAGGGYSTGRLAIVNGSEAKNFSNPRALGYTGYRNGRWTTHGGVSTARMSYETRRAIDFAALTPLGDRLLFGGVKREATSAPSGLTVETWAEQRFELDLGPWSVFPSAGLRFARYGRHSWKETGAGDLSVSGHAQALTSKEMDLGLLLVRATGRFQPHASAMYRRGVGNRSTRTTLQLSGADLGGFAVDGLPLARGIFVGRAGMVLRTRSINASVSYEIQRGSFQRQHVIQISFGHN